MHTRLVPPQGRSLLPDGSILWALVIQARNSKMMLTRKPTSMNTLRRNDVTQLPWTSPLLGKAITDARSLSVLHTHTGAEAQVTESQPIGELTRPTAVHDHLRHEPIEFVRNLRVTPVLHGVANFPVLVAPFQVGHRPR